MFKCVASVLPEGSVLAYAADGSLVVMPGQRSDAASPPELPLTIQAVRWSVAAPGHLVGLGCGDVIAAEFFDAEAAASSRERMRSITL